MILEKLRNQIKSWTFILFYLFKKFTVKLKVKSKTSKKFKKGISFVFTLVDLHCFSLLFNSQFNLQLNKKFKF